MTERSGNGWIHVAVPEHACSIWQRGRHGDGTYLRVYVPDRAASPEEPLRTVLYLHGFALCMPSFYDDHLLALAEEGYIVFFPDFQRSAYPAPSPLAPVQEREDLPHRRLWAATALRLALRPAEAAVEREDLHPLLAIRDGAGAEPAARGMEPPTVGDLRRVVVPLLLIELILAVIGWFRRTWARNLSLLLSTVALSLASSPDPWLAQAIALTEADC
jgi:hypothetical protein